MVREGRVKVPFLLFRRRFPGNVGGLSASDTRHEAAPETSLPLLAGEVAPKGSKGGLGCDVGVMPDLAQRWYPASRPPSRAAPVLPP